MTREEKVIEEVEREHEKKGIKITEQDKFIGNLARKLNPIFDVFFTELLENLKKDRVGSDVIIDKTVNECKKTIEKILIQKKLKTR